MTLDGHWWNPWTKKEGNVSRKLESLPSVALAEEGSFDEFSTL